MTYFEVVAVAGDGGRVAACRSGVANIVAERAGIAGRVPAAALQASVEAEKRFPSSRFRLRPSSLGFAKDESVEGYSRAIALESGASESPFAFVSVRNGKANLSAMTSSLVVRLIAGADAVKKHAAAAAVAFDDCAPLMTLDNYFRSTDF